MWSFFYQHRSTFEHIRTTSSRLLKGNTGCKKSLATNFELTSRNPNTTVKTVEKKKSSHLLLTILLNTLYTAVRTIPSLFKVNCLVALSSPKSERHASSTTVLFYILSVFINLGKVVCKKTKILFKIAPTLRFYQVFIHSFVLLLFTTKQNQ